MENVIAWGNALPVYPIEAERAGWEGEVVLRLSCEKGKVTGAVVEKSSGYASLDESARAAATNWRFPAERVGAEATITVQFQID